MSWRLPHLYLLLKYCCQTLLSYDSNAMFKPLYDSLEVTMTMNVNLSPQLDEMVRQKVASGLYTSASEVVREALRLMEQQDCIRAAKLEQLRHDIRDGTHSGESTLWDPEEIKQEGRKIRAARSIAKQ
jgi:antitoxin ParD1/3/4